MSSSGEEEETGPSVDSNDQEERIAARRLRIQKRVEVAKRAALGEDTLEKKEIKEELSKSRKQIEDSRLRLTKLKSDGTELVTNIRVAGDARESQRRLEEDETKRQRKEKLDLEAKSGTEKFDEITKKWETALQKEIPQALHEMLVQQKTSCDAMIDEKNKLINDFQLELKAKDDHYVKDLKKQAEDVDLSIERMEEQVKNLTRAYREELTQIERACVAERGELMDAQHRKWEEKMQNRRDKEVDYMKSRQKRVDDYEGQLQHLRVQDGEEYNLVKIRLETDVQILEQQLQQMRATYQLNQEKLEYNFQVLKKRDDENTITKSQQKRKITRLQDVLNSMRGKLAKQEKNYKDENQQLSEDYKRITEQFRDLQRKSKHFMAADNQKFHDVWCMNEEESKELLTSLVEAHRVVQEQQLGLTWAVPNLSFTENVGPVISEASRRKAVSANQVVQEVMSSTSGQSGRDMEDGANKEDDGEMAAHKIELLSKISASTIKTILELLCDESGFLVETKLNKLLTPLEKDERSLMKLDAIFTALGVDTEDDINKLASYFMHMLTGEDKSRAADYGSPRDGERDEKRDLDTEKMSTQRSRQSGVSRASHRSEDAVDVEVDRVTGKDDEFTPRTGRSEGATVELIHPNEVLKALRTFVEDNRKPIKEKGKQSHFKITALDERDDSDDSMYWASYAGALGQGTEKVWDALLEGFQKYSEVLTGRANLIAETDALRQQNAELQMLLHQYINSKVNSELEIPPTRILQLELNPPM